MLTIRRAQVQRLATARQAQFVRDLEDYAWGFAPMLCRVAGRSAVSNAVRLAMERAHECGWDDRELTRYYLELSLSFGADFAGDPQYRWADCIRRTALCAPQMQACIVHYGVIDYFETVVGDNNEFAVAAYNRGIRREAEQAYSVLPSSSADIVPWLNSIYPQKLDHVRHAGISGLVALAETIVAQHDLPQEAGVALFVYAMLLLGSGVLSDPMYPWFRSVVLDARIVTPEARLTRLTRKVHRYVLAAGRYLTG